MLSNVSTRENSPLPLCLPNNPTDLCPKSIQGKIQLVSAEHFESIKGPLTDLQNCATLSDSAQKNSYQREVETVSPLSKPEAKGQASAKFHPPSCITEAKFALIKRIFETEFKHTASLYVLEDPNHRVATQLNAIDLIPDGCCAHQGIRKDDLRLAIVTNTYLSNKDRCQALYSLEADNSQIEALKACDLDGSFFKALRLDIKLKKLQLKGLCPSLPSVKQQKKLSKNLLHFYFLNENSGINKSFEDLLQLAFILDRTQQQVYPGHTITVCDSDAALISLALNASFSLQDRLRALRPILSIDAKLNIPELKAFLNTHISAAAISHNISPFELISPIAFSSDLALLLLPNSQDVLTLYTLVQSYYAIPKGVKDHFHHRTELLNEVIAKTQRILENLNEYPEPSLSGLHARQIRSLRNIQNQAQHKIYYLKKLPGLKQKALYWVDHSAKAKYALAQNISVLNVVGDVLRNLDPLKREGLYQSLELWRKMVNEDPETPHFWLWLDKIDTSDQQDPRYSLWNKEQKRVQFQEGLAYNAVFGNKDDNNRLDGPYIYNIGQDTQLYILPNYTHEGIRLTHDTILKGNNILSAGVVVFRQGKLVYINVASGHYKPDRFKNLQPTLAYFLEKHPGAIHADTQIGNYDKSHPIYPYATFKDMKASEGEKERASIRLEQLGFKC